MKPRMVNIDTEIDAEIKTLTIGGNFNFSDWIRRRFKDEFLSEDSLKARISGCDSLIISAGEEKKRLIILLHQAEQSKTELKISDKERDFMETVPARLKKGYPIKAILKGFNAQFGRQVNYREFEAILKEANKNG